MGRILFTTIQSYKQALKRPAAVFGEIKLEDIDFLMVKQFITDLQTTKAESGKKPLAHGTIVTYYTTLHTLFESAVENGVIVQNPMQRMKKPKLPSYLKRIFDRFFQEIRDGTPPGRGVAVRLQALHQLTARRTPPATHHTPATASPNR